MANAGTLQIMVVGDTGPLVTSMHAGAKSVATLETAAVSLSTQLLDEERVLRMGADAALDFKMALAGVSKEQRDALQAQRDIVNGLKAEAEARRDMEDRQFAAFLQEEKAAKDAARKAQDSLNETMMRGRAVADSVLTPVERYQKEVADLSQLLRRGAISQEVFNRAVSKARGSMDEAVAGAPMLDRIKKMFGSRGALKDVVELAVGGGAIAGISFLTNTIERATENAKKLSMEFRAGTKTTGELVDESLKLVPIFGDIYGAGRNIREIFTGEAAALAKVNAEAQRLDETMEIVKKFAEGLKGVFSDAAQQTRDFQEEAQRLALDLLPEGPQRDKAKIEFEITTDAKRAADNLRKQFEALTVGPRKELVELQKALMKIQTPNRGMVATDWGGDFGTASAFEEESDADYQKRLDAVKAQRSAIEMQMKVIEGTILAARESVLGVNDSALDALEAGALEKLKTQLSLFDKQQRDMMQTATEAGVNSQFEKWTDKYNTALETSKELIKSLKTPAEKYADQLKTLDDLLQRNMISQQQYGLAVADAKLEMAEGNLNLHELGRQVIKPIELQFAMVTDVGTGATDALASKIASAVGANVADSTEKKQLAELQKQVRELQELNRKLKVGSVN